MKYNVHVVLHNYPGYGGDYVAKPRVKCDEVTLKEDCVELLEVLKAEPWFKGTEVIVLGNSIGVFYDLSVYQETTLIINEPRNRPRNVDGLRKQPQQSRNQ